jgi:hypothetical protein
MKFNIDIIEKQNQKSEIFDMYKMIYYGLKKMSENSFKYFQLFIKHMEEFFDFSAYRNLYYQAEDIRFMNSVFLITGIKYSNWKEEAVNQQITISPEYTSTSFDKKVHTGHILFTI